jgi:hypothetical protein
MTELADASTAGEIDLIKPRALMSLVDEEGARTGSVLSMCGAQDVQVGDHGSQHERQEKCSQSRPRAVFVGRGASWQVRIFS